MIFSCENIFRAQLILINIFISDFQLMNYLILLVNQYSLTTLIKLKEKWYLHILNENVNSRCVLAI